MDASATSERRGRGIHARALVDAVYESLER